MATPASELPSPPRRDGFYVHRGVLITLGALVVLGIGFVFGRLVDRDGDHRFGDLRDHGGHPALRILIVVVLLALLVTGIVLLVRHFSGQPGDSPATAEQTLADRFARGEIDEEEFLRRRNALRT